MPAVAGIEPEKLLKELAKLWVELGKADGEKTDASVLRACSMTLIVAAEQEEDVQIVGETIGELIHENPSRAIVVRVGSDESSELDARVFAQCWMPFGGHQQICCEQIEFTSSTSRLADLPQIVLSLIAPDLPVVLWSRSARIAANDSFERLFPMADKIIVDSAGFPDAASGLAFVSRLRAQGINVADLVWTRLTRWREVIALIFEDRHNHPFLCCITRARITHRGTEVPVAAHYLAGWLRQALAQPLETSFQPAASASEEDIVAVTLEGEGFVASATLMEGSFAALRVNEWTSKTIFPRATEAQLLNEELGILGHDPIFLKVLG